MATFRPILISTVQYDSELRAKSVSQVDAIAIAQRLGADGAELRAAYWHDKERELPAARRRKDELGMIVTYATDLPLFASDPGGSLSLRQALDDAVALGSPLVRVFPGVTPGDDYRLAWDMARELVKDAAARGIVVAVENFGRPPGCRLAEIQRVLDRIDSPALGT